MKIVYIPLRRRRESGGGGSTRGSGTNYLDLERDQFCVRKCVTGNTDWKRQSGVGGGGGVVVGDRYDKTCQSNRSHRWPLA